MITQRNQAIGRGDDQAQTACEHHRQHECRQRSACRARLVHDDSASGREWNRQAPLLSLGRPPIPISEFSAAIGLVRAGFREVAIRRRDLFGRSRLRGILGRNDLRALEAGLQLFVGGLGKGGGRGESDRKGDYCGDTFHDEFLSVQNGGGGSTGACSRFVDGLHCVRPERKDKYLNRGNIVPYLGIIRIRRRSSKPLLVLLEADENVGIRGFLLAAMGA